MTRVKAFDSGCQVTVEVTADPDESGHSVHLTIGTEEVIELSVLETERVIDALQKGLERIQRLRQPSARD